MSTLNLTILIQKLDITCKQSLEQATALCLKRQHYNVELEHWLHILLNNKETDLFKLLQQNNCEVTEIQEGINRNLEKLKQGNEQTPAISERVIEWINESWLITSLDHGLDQINTGMLLLALLQNPILNQLCLNLSIEFKKLSIETIKQQLVALPKQSSKSKNNENMANSALDQFTTNLTQQAKLGKLDDAVCRENEIRQVMQILARRRQNNAILVGEPGVGKTAIAEGLALRISKGDVPALLQAVNIHSLDLGLLQAGASLKGEFEKRLKNLIQEIKNSTESIILFIDEAHMLVGAAAQSGQNDAANLLKPALARGELHCIAATTWREYKKYFESDTALTRRFQVVKVPEPDITSATYMLRSMITSLEKHHEVLILDDAIKQATRLSARYISDRFLPDKAISVLDTACARVASQHHTTPNIIEQKQRNMAHLKTEKTQLLKEAEHGITATQRLDTLTHQINMLKNEIEELNVSWKNQNEIVKEILELTHQLRNEMPENAPNDKSVLQKKLHLAKKKLETSQKDDQFVHAYVDSQMVTDVISDWTGIPVGNMLKDQAQRFLDLQTELDQKIIGQTSAIQRLASTTKTAGANLTDPNKPLGIFLFVGPSGIGKTETALVLAESLFGSRDKVITMNMSEFKEAHKVALLTGAPPGYVGYGEGGVLTEAARRQPYSIILLDEMEKANPIVQDIFYQVFDKGVLQDSQGRLVSFKNTLIIMTANSCSQLISDYWEKDPALLDQAEFHKALENELLKTFKPAFLGRIKVIPYLPLDEDAIVEIAHMKLKQIEKRLSKEHKISLNMTDSASKAIVKHCNNTLIGARQIDAILNQIFLPEIANLVLSQIAEDKKINTIDVRYQNDQWQFEPSYGNTNESHKTKIVEEQVPI